MPDDTEPGKDCTDDDALASVLRSATSWRFLQKRMRSSTPKPHPRLSELADAQIRRRLEVALSGDAAAMDDLVANLAPIVHLRVARALMRRRGQSRGRELRQDLEDLVQDVFAALFANGGQALLRWDPERGLSFEGFVGFLAERVVGMTMRSGRRNPWTEDPTAADDLEHLHGTAPPPSDRLESQELLERIADHLRERLTPRGRHYFQLMYVENRPIKDVAEATGTTAQALYAWRNRLMTALRQLKIELESEEPRHV